MTGRAQFSGIMAGIFLSIGCLQTTELLCNYVPFPINTGNSQALYSCPIPVVNSANEVEKLNHSLKGLLLKYDYKGSKLIIDKLIDELSNKNLDSLTVSESYYLIGVYHSFTRNVPEAIRYLNLCIFLKESGRKYDERYGDALYNLGVLYGRMGDFRKHEDFTMRSLDVERRNYGDMSPLLISTYSSLIIAYIELQEYEKSQVFANKALSIATNKSGTADAFDMASLYNNLGGLYIRLADYTRAKIYLEKAESIYKNNNLYSDENYINLLNNLAITSGALNLPDKSDNYYNKGLSLAVSNNSSISYNIVNSYAIVLGNKGMKDRGENLLSDALGRAKVKFGVNSRNYFEVLANYADYLREYNIDNNKSLEYYEKCIGYLNRNPQDVVLKNPFYLGYSLSLTKAGQPYKALETIQKLLFPDSQNSKKAGILDNPEIENIRTDKKSLKIIKTKYEILQAIYRISPDQKVLEAVARTAELIVSIIEKLRINISEEESRLILGDRYRDTYLNAIRDFNLLYHKTGSRQFLDKAFEYSEKSKVAGLLTATRELNAIQFHIPSGIAEFETNLKRNISIFNARIAAESIKSDPDTMLIKQWTENLFESTRLRDSLILVFEQQYPDYYAIKYNTKVVEFKDIPKLTGRNINYINYIVSDTTIYIFIANAKHQELIALTADSSFFNKIRQFRNLLTKPLSSENARVAFEEFKTTGYILYKTLFEPVRKYLISDKVLISPDNILSYLPFETILTNQTDGKEMQYRDLAYLMKDFDISYTYSATFAAESAKRDYSIDNKLIAFAPDYPEPIDIQSVVMNRQYKDGILGDLPYARKEAEYVADLTGGKLFENKEAKESVFKAEAGKFDIIHLAMHTILNDKDPMYSTLIFSPENNSSDDRFLKTFEVYGIPLKAKMIVLSSCNTGTGYLYSGEGILSLARGFIYSGGQSVVMSMWEIEDKSGTEIVKMFYKNLKSGNSKSKSLRKSRMSYLKNTDQFRAHPYFWSTLIIYGNNAPLYYSKYITYGTFLLVSIIALVLFIYFRKRRYS
jgi:CHAT domain-containing protein